MNHLQNEKLMDRTLQVRQVSPNQDSEKYLRSNETSKMTSFIKTPKNILKLQEKTQSPSGSRTRSIGPKFKSQNIAVHGSKIINNG